MTGGEELRTFDVRVELVYRVEAIDEVTAVHRVLAEPGGTDELVSWDCSVVADGEADRR